MIFRSFSNNDDGFLSKIGIYKKSFKEIGEACGNAFNDSLGSSIAGLADGTGFDITNNKGFFKNLISNLSTPIEEEFDLYDKLILRQKDIEPFFKYSSAYKNYGKSDAQNDLNKLQNYKKLVDSNGASWQDYYSTFETHPELKWQEKLIQECDLEKLSLDDLQKAQLEAALAAKEHDEKLKDLTIGAKASKFAINALTMVGNALVIKANKEAAAKAQGDVNALATRVETLESVEYVEATEAEIKAMFPTA